MDSKILVWSSLSEESSESDGSSYPSSSSLVKNCNNVVSYLAYELLKGLLGMYGGQRKIAKQKLKSQAIVVEGREFSVALCFDLCGYV